MFPNCAASSWFQVKGAATNITIHIMEMADAVGKAYYECEEEGNASASALEILQEWETMQEQWYADGKAMRRVKELDTKNEAHSWLNRVGWTRYLEGLEVEELQQMAKPPDKGEIGLEQMSKHYRNVLNEAYKTCHSYRIGLLAMFEIN